ncbi:hypothetical protein E4Z66_06455 [Aliishimia ponticola]|uniref:Uncharacterized protein n=1 Tax=Aliishimia ponticola TaxID=2499833 RepID=A0A4S4NFQ7_9RHOB|nr:DUF6478 family protein [Aliishimia ponticola]THH37447.1 hypothetical protein E4Z66_06455 [Aliishimia ponticola]
MGQEGGGLLDTVFFQRTMRRWARAARQATRTDLDVLRQQRQRARALRVHLESLIYKAEERLALPAVGSNNFPRPYNADWGWRPELWRGPLPIPGISSVQNKATLGKEVTMFHDCAFSEVTLRQLRNLREEDLAPYGLRMDVFRFDGSYLSMVIDLPEEAVVGLRKSHLIRLTTIVEMEQPIEIFARLNIKHGPNTEQVVRELPLTDAHVEVEFDLAYTNLNERRVEKAWVDLIFEGPEMNQVILRDVTFARRPRASM